MKRLNLLTVLPLMLIAGCIVGTVRGKQAEACSNLNSLDRSIAVLRRLITSKTTTVDALRQAEGQVSAAFRDFKASTEDVPEAKTDELEKAYEDLDKAVKDVSAQSAMTQAMASVISEKVTTVESASSRAQAGLRCP